MSLNYQELDASDLEFVVVANSNELKNGEKLFLEIDDIAIILFNIAGKYFAIGNICSHDGEDLENGDVEAGQVICPRHGARFEISNGKVAALPAIEDIPSYPVQLENEEILIGIPIAS
jgi:3-phenylpropionate/trans-cinnamate dioxygenase ferredoxin subunit